MPQINKQTNRKSDVVANVTVREGTGVTVNVPVTKSTVLVKVRVCADTDVVANVSVRQSTVLVANVHIIEGISTVANVPLK